MNGKTDAIDVADELLNSVGYMRTLLGAARDKVQFYLSNGPQLGPYRELLAQHAAEMDDLLELIERFLDKLEGQVDTVTDLLYAAQPQAAG